jgi:hypothetical protein
MLAMGTALVYGFTQGSLSDDGRVLLSIPWGVVSLIDVYVGFTLFCGWVFFRERSPLVAAVWTVLIMVLGFFTASLYALLALYSSQGGWSLFWMGYRAEGLRNGSEQA